MHSIIMLDNAKTLNIFTLISKLLRSSSSISDILLVWCELSWYFDICNTISVFWTAANILNVN